jgi:hypothetical protein
VLFFDRPESADARADDGPHALVIAPVDREARVLHGHVGAGQGVDDEIVEPAQLLLPT